MSRTRSLCRGQVIEVTSYPLRGSGFTVHFDLEHHFDSHVDVEHFETGQRFNSDDEAQRAGLLLGRHQVDLVGGR